MPVSPEKALLLQRVGKAVAVVVEGKEAGGDAWIYGDAWFGHLAPRISFIPVGANRDVREYVSQMRAEPPNHPVFGLIDRDVTLDDELDNLVEEGIFRSRRYSVENYLLDPDCWLKTFRHIAAPRGGLPLGWQSDTEVTAAIEGAYRRLAPISAFNRVVSAVKQTCPDYVAPKFYRDANNFTEAEGTALLSQWQARCGHPDDLAARYVSERERLLKADLDRLHTLIDGKLVLEELLQAFWKALPHNKRERRPKLDSINDYLRECPNPPADALQLVERILQAAGR